MEKFDHQPPHRMTPEAIRQAQFSETLHTVLFRMRQEAPTISTFRFGGKEYPVNSVPGAVKALGQNSSSIAYGVYKEVVRP